MKKQNDLVSIIIPCYNYGQFVQEAIDSALNQTYSNIEVIVVNDGSTDKLTNDFFNTYSHPKVKLVNQQNQGLPMARNNAISASSGKFFIPLDADDKLDKTFIEKTMDVIQTNANLGVVYTDQQFFGEENTIMPMKDFNFVDELVLNHVSVCSLINREVYNKVKEKNGFGYNPNMKYGYEDWDLWINIAELGYEFKCVHEPLFFYRKSKTSMMSNTIKKHDYLMNQLLDNHKESYLKYFKEAFVNLHLLYKDKELLSVDLQKQSKNNTWLVKRIIKNLKKD